MGVSVERDLVAGRSHTHRIDLESGQFLSLTIQQQGIDVAASLLRPDGAELVSTDAFNDDFRAETLMAIADSAGTHTIRIVTAPGAQPRGRYTIVLEERRPSGSTDETRIAAERSFAQGLRTRAAGQPATWGRALESFNDSLARFREVSDRRGEMKSLLEITTTQYYMLLPESLTSAQEGERIAREIGDRAAMARVLRSRGNILVFQGDLDAAAGALEESAQICHAIGSRTGEGRALNDAAIAYRRGGDVQRAIATYERALPLARATKDAAAEARILNNLGVAYRWVGDDARAIGVYQQALAHSRTAKDEKGQFYSLNNLGILHRESRRYQKALSLHQEALTLTRKVGDEEMEAALLISIGDDFLAMKQAVKALEYSHSSLGIQRRIGHLSGQAMALYASARALRTLGRTEEALEALRESLAIYRKTHETFKEGEILHELAEVERDQGDLSSALRDIRSAVDLDESLRTRMTSPELRTTFVASAQDRYALFIDVLQMMHRADPSAGYDGKALEVNERARARALLDSILDPRVDLRQGIDPALLDRERTLQKKISDASEELSKSLSSGATQGTGAPTDTLDRLTDEYRQLQLEIRQKSPRYAAVTQPQPLSIGEIQQSLLDEQTVLLEFELGKERSWLWAVTPGSVLSVELPARSKVEPAARLLYERFTARQRRPQESAGDYRTRVAAADAALTRQAAVVSRLLLGGIAGKLEGPWRGKRLVVVTAGALEYLPLAALPVPSALGSSPAPSLLSRHEIVSIPSASVIGVIRRETAGRMRAPRPVVIFADPVFEAVDPRVAAGGRGGTGGASPSTMNPPVTAPAGGRWKRLPFSREESRSIAALEPTNGVLEATGFQANRDFVLGGSLSSYRIVHFATHGVLDSAHPALSGLVLSLVDERGASQDGFLHLNDIYNLRLGADLVVLSACQTALGKDVQGEGLVSLTRAFMYAGSPRVIASLWRVDDLATAELMKRFYRGVLLDGLGPAAALRAAQLEMSRDSRWSAPYYWAGFVMQGDWRYEEAQGQARVARLRQASPPRALLHFEAPRS